MIYVATEALPLLGPVTAACTERGLVLLSLAEPSEARAWLQARYPGTTLSEAPSACEAVFTQLSEYLNGSRTTFTLSLDPHGTSFQQQVWAAVAAVPYGETRSYAEIAATVGRPAAARAVGAANGANPLCIVVPCHRIIGAGGHLTGYAYGLEYKRRLLELERRVKAQQQG